MKSKQKGSAQSRLVPGVRYPQGWECALVLCLAVVHTPAGSPDAGNLAAPPSGDHTVTVLGLHSHSLSSCPWSPHLGWHVTAVRQLGTNGSSALA